MCKGSPRTCVNDVSGLYKPLAPGTYLMNIVAHQATARVVFTVEDPAAKVKLPSLDSILGFLKKKAS